MSGSSGGRSWRLHQLLNMSQPLLTVPLPQLLLVLLLTTSVTAEFTVHVEIEADNDVSRYRLPREESQMLRTGKITLPVEAYLFDNITLSRENVHPIRRLTGIRACECRHRCLADPTCMLYVHEREGDMCSLHDFLMPEEPANASTEGRTVGRRRGISWLGAPCSNNASCSLLTRNAECGADGECVCSLPGWTAAHKTLCRPDGYWKTSGPLNDTQLLDEVEAAAEIGCAYSCRRSSDCWAYSYSESSLRCRRFAAGVLTDQEQDVGTIYAVWVFGRKYGAPPEGYETVSGRFFRLTPLVTGDQAAEACLDIDGVPYPGDDPQLMTAVDHHFQYSPYWVGLSDQLTEGRFEAADGVQRRIYWANGQPDNSTEGNIQDCVSFSRIDKSLHNEACYSEHPMLCEYIGPNLLTSPPSPPQKDPARQLTWWTFDLQEILQVSRLLYLAGNMTERLQLTEVRIGHYADAVKDPSSTLCFRRQGALAAEGFSLRLACEEPRAGRYLHVGQRPGGDPLWKRLAIYGN
ncbi:hypothetical protein FJT64_025591 [Amphibalanus amphitrite]|uniref:C-type lectin domain-containing protein n=1 Tax=Amphibalanus amphitrite TaxID=1232801 RepID=A0A6A4WHQ6_AMPAM|nr:hypothetical protein FJT64_025591 [Amphibalanus amphitrite]